MLKAANTRLTVKSVSEDDSEVAVGVHVVNDQLDADPTFGFEIEGDKLATVRITP